MKKFSNYFLMMFAVFALGFLASCGDDEETPVIEGAPSISIVGDPDLTFQDEAGETVSFTVKAEAPLGFNTFRVTKSVDGDNDISYSDEITKNDDEYTGNNTLTYNFTYTLLGSEIDKAVIFNFQVVDDEGNTEELDVTIDTEAPAEETVSAYETFLLVPPAGDGSTETFFSTQDGERYSVNEINSADGTSPKIDFGYYFGATDKASLASPASFPKAVYDLSTKGWDQYNETIFRTTELSVSEFEEITVYDNSALSAAFELGTATTAEGIVTQLEVDQIYAFSTDSEKVGGVKFGLVRVISIKEGAGTDAGVNLEVKVEK